MNILIIENSQTLSQLINKTLKAYGYNATLDNENLTNRTFIKSNIFDIVILNTDLDKNRSLKILAYIKEHSSNTKVLGVCNRGSWIQKVDFLKKGGDDVLTYPFPMQELLARIQSISRRPKNYMDSTMYIGDFKIDVDSKCVFKNSKELELRKKEYELLEYLLRNKDRTISRCELLDHVWDYRKYTGSNTVDVHIKRLRDKLHDKGLIKTIHGVGYQIKAKK